MFSEMNMFWKSLYFLAVIPVYGIIFTVIYTFTVYFLYDGQEFTNFKIVMCISFYLFAFMTILCHTLSMIMSPGFVDLNVYKKYDKSIEEIIDIKDYNGHYCKKCLKPRPERSHHCSTCKKCVLKMDHHCPWIFNCVGFANQKAFYLFLFYAAFGDLIACISLTTKILEPNFFEMLIRPKRRMDFKSNLFILEVLKSMKDPLLIIIGTVLSFTMALAIGGLFFYQTYLIANNITSIESSMYEKKEYSPYHTNNKLLNLKSVLGFEPGIQWFIPIFKPNKYNLGYSFYIPCEYRPQLNKQEKEVNKTCSNNSCNN